MEKYSALSEGLPLSSRTEKPKRKVLGNAIRAFAAATVIAGAAGCTNGHETSHPTKPAATSPAVTAGTHFYQLNTDSAGNILVDVTPTVGDSIQYNQISVDNSGTILVDPTKEPTQSTSIHFFEEVSTPEPTVSHVTKVTNTPEVSPTVTEISTEVSTNIATAVPTDTSTPTEAPTKTATPTETPTSTSTVEPTKTVFVKPEKSPTPDPTATATKEVSPKATATKETVKTISEQLKAVNADTEKMAKLAAVNTEMYANAAPQYLCLQGVRLSIDQVLPDMDGPLSAIGSAYLARDVFRAHPDEFAEIHINSREDLYRLPVGAIIVYQPNTDGNNYDFADGEHRGHVEIIDSKNGQGTVIVGSDHLNSIDTDLMQLNGEVNVFVIIKPKESHPTKKEAVSIADPLPVVENIGREAPEYYSSAKDYEKAIKENFNITMEGYDKDHLEWTWELLWKTSKTNFPSLLEGNTYIAAPYDPDPNDPTDGITSDDVSYEMNCQTDSRTGKGTAAAISLVTWPGKDDFLNYFIHESAHGIQACQPDSKSKFKETIKVFQQEGGIDWYGNNAETVFDGVKDINENYAEGMRLILDEVLFPNYQKSLLAVGPQNEINPFSIYSGPYKKIYQQILFQKNK